MPSISAVAKEARMSRQAIYASYPEIVGHINGEKSSRTPELASRVSAKNLILRKRVASESKKVALLSTLVVELMAELTMTRDDLGNEIERLRRQLEIAASRAQLTKRRKP
jgi:hypothetical protein